MHTLLRMIISQPQMLLAHASAYMALVQEQGNSALRQLYRQVCWLALSTASLAVSATLAGVALMLWCLAPQQAGFTAPWVLVAVPCVPLVTGLWAAFQASRFGPVPLCDALQQQLAADLSLFDASAP